MKKQKLDAVEKYLEEFAPEANKNWVKKSILDFVDMGITRMKPVMLNLAQKCILTGNYVVGCASMGMWLFNDSISKVLALGRDMIQSKVDQTNALDSEEKSLEIMNKTQEKATETIKNDSGYEVAKKIDPASIVFLSGNYISKAKQRRDRFVRTGMSIVTTGALVASSVALGVQSAGSIPVFLGVMGGTLGTSVYMAHRKIRRGKEYQGKWSQLNKKIERSKQDLFKVRATSDKHKEFMIDKYREVRRQSDKEQVGIWKEDGIDRIANNVINTLAALGLGLISIDLGDLSNISTIVNGVTLFGAYQGVLSTSQTLVHNIASFKEEEARFRETKEAMKDILPVYKKEKEKEKEVDREEIHNINIQDFVYEYCGENGEKDRYVNIPRLELEAGETLLITGRSGSGKSTFIKALMGMNYPEIEGKPITINGDKQVDKLYNVSFNDDVKDLMGNNTLLEEITFSKDKKDIDFDKLERILDGVDILDTLKTKFPGRDLKAVLESAFFDTFSGGESSKLKLARMLYQLDDKTDIICMDEPTGRLDPRSAVKVMKFVKEFANEDKKRAMIMVSHDMNLMQSDVYDKWQYIDDNYTFQEIHSEEEKKDLLQVYTKDISQEEQAEVEHSGEKLELVSKEKEQKDLQQEEKVITETEKLLNLQKGRDEKDKAQSYDK